jgi:hypothetical protein
MLDICIKNKYFLYSKVKSIANGDNKMVTILNLELHINKVIQLF